MQIGSLIRRAARQFGDAPCLTEGDHTISFAEFDRATDRLGNALLALGLEPGDRVGTLLPNCIDCLIAYYALAKAGLVRVSLNSRETAEDHRYKLQDSGSRGVLQGGSESFGLEFEIDHNALTKLIESGDQKSCRQDRELHGIYRLAYTGGTTGRPKGVTLTTAGELWELGSFLADLLPDIHPGDIFLHASPISHASGAFFLPGLVRGAQALILPKFAPQAFIDLAATSGASMTFLVPTMLAMILEAPGIDSAELRFRGIAYGASPIAPSLYKRAQARFGPIFSQAYGQAESP
ncbi:MAG: AMP-binding protein, partial [Salinisphaera sp.]|nr:AMP-binding protein [Salinisphaera sp.]